MAGADTATERAEELARRVLPDRTPKRRMLVIVNPYASTVSDRLKNLVVHALQSRYDVEAVDTQARQHATEVCRQATREGYDVVVAFGGDGTVNEAVNGLVDTGVPLTSLPGGSTNVFCRLLGIPTDVVDATEHLLAMADRFTPRRVDAGRVNGRYFAFASGAGLDASVVERVDRRPRLKTRLSRYYFTYSAVATFNRRYVLRPPRLRVEAGGRMIEGVTAVVQNADAFTYFGDRPIRICEGGGLETGTLSIAVLKRASPLGVPTVGARLFSSRAATVQRHRAIAGLAGVREARVVAMGEAPVPIQVDGDYLGDFEAVTYGVAPGALAVVA